MKKIVTIIFLVFAFTFTAQAQKRGGKPSAEKMLTKMTKELNLTETQQSKIKPLLEAQIADRMAMNEKRKASKDSGQKPSKEERKQQREVRMEKEAAFNTEMASILDKEQLVKFEEITKERKEKSKDRGKNKRQ
jgi:Spy/CpxP family protein refolding chaperone